MKTTLATLPKNSVTITVELSPDELRPHLDRAAERLSKHRPIPGFRPGKATAAVMEKAVGADALYHEAAEAIIRETFPKAVAEHKLTTVGAPEIELQKVAPGNPLIYKAVVTLLPEVKLGDFRGLKIKKRPVTVSNEETEKLLTELRSSRASEALVNRPVRDGDKAEIDFAGTLDEVAVEGAASKNHPLVIGANTFVPGFEKPLIGMTTGETKEFPVRFPKDYRERRLADRTVLFRVTVRAVYERTLPAVDDAFAKSVGNFTDLAALTERLEENLLASKREKERERYELAMLEKIVEISTFGELPDRLVDEEAEKMVEELRQSITENGMEFPKYLESIKKTVDELKAEFRPRAERRLKISLATRAIAKQEHIEVSDADVEKEIAETKKLYAGNSDVERNLASDDYARYLKNVLTSKQVTEFLDDLIGVAEEATTSTNR